MLTLSNEISLTVVATVSILILLTSNLFILTALSTGVIKEILPVLFLILSSLQIEFTFC